MPDHEPAPDDYLALRALAEGYASGIDRRDPALLISVFHHDARLRVFNPSDADEPRSEMRGHEALAQMTERIAAYSKTFHFLGQSVYDVGDATATGEVYCTAHHLTPDRHGGTDYVMLIRYRDEYRRDENARWKITDRQVLVDWSEVRTANPAGR